MTIHYREIQADEIFVATDVFLQGLNALMRRNGLPEPRGYTSDAITPLYGHLREHGIFQVAEENGRVIAICSGVLRERLWFLSMFWTLPEERLRGVGNPLLKRVLEEARRRGAMQYATWSSIDYTALALYLKLGWMPQGPILTFGGEPSQLLPEPSHFALRPLDPDFASSLDAQVRGVARPVDHAYFRASAADAFQVESASEPVGYFYVSGGAIGPAAWRRAEDAPKLLAHALHRAQRQSAFVKLVALGSNTDAIRAALAAGLKLTGTSHFLATSPFGTLSQYVPSGPGLF